MNDRSSRSHSIVALSLRQTRASTGAMLESKLYLVDLGGSEQVKRSKAEGDRFREAVEINRSLTALGRVVDALVADRVESDRWFLGTPSNSSKFSTAAESNSFSTILKPSVLARRGLDDWRESSKIVPERSS